VITQQGRVASTSHAKMNFVTFGLAELHGYR
jgi:hypothetical protein